MSDPFKPSRQQVDTFLSNLHTHSEFCLAKYKRAERYRDTHAVRQANGSRFDLSCSLSDFRKYGPGVYLFFRFIRVLAVMFLLLFLVSVPSMASNYSGKGLEIYGNADSTSLRIMKLSLANQRYYEWSRLTPDQLTNVTINRRIIVCTDLLVSIVFFFFMVYWSVESDRIVREFILDTVLPSYHTIFLPDLPAFYTEQKIIQHFTKFGRVAQVSSVKDISRILDMVKKFGQLVDQFKILQATSNQEKQQQLYELYVEILSQYNMLKNEYRTLEQQPYISAFVSFQSAKTRNLTLELYSEDDKVFADRLLFQGEKLSVQKCNMEPINIIWENIHIRTLKDIQKGVLMGMSLFVLLFTSLSVLFFIKVKSNTGFLIDEMENYTFDEVLERKNQNHVTDTFCLKLNYQAYKPEYYEICRASFSRFTSHLIWTISFSFVIVFVNYLIGIVIRALANFRQYRTNTDKNRFLIVNYFIFYFINTALLTLMVQGEVANMSFKTIVNKIFNLQSKLVQVTIYNEFTRRWYIDMGRQILINFMVSLIFCPLFGVLVAYGWQQYRRTSAQFATIQRQMNLILVDKELDFNIYYGLTLNTIFFTMFYSPGLPILYLLAALAMISIYLSSKYIFIRFSCQPSRFDHTLNEVITGLLPFALLVHQFTSFSFFTVNEIFPKLVEDPQFFRRLLYRLSEGFLFELIAISIVIYIVLRKKCDKMFRTVFNDLPELHGRRKSDRQKAFELLCANGDFLYSYKFEDNPNYRDAFYAITVLDLLDKKHKQHLRDTPSRISQSKLPKVKSCQLLDEAIETYRAMDV